MDSETRGKRLPNEELFSKLGLRRFVNTPEQQHQYRQNETNNESSSRNKYTITIVLIALLFSLYM